MINFPQEPFVVEHILADDNRAFSMNITNADLLRSLKVDFLSLRANLNQLVSMLESVANFGHQVHFIMRLYDVYAPDPNSKLGQTRSWVFLILPTTEENSRVVLPNSSCFQLFEVPGIFYMFDGKIVSQFGNSAAKSRNRLLKTDEITQLAIFVLGQLHINERWMYEERI